MDASDADCARTDATIAGGADGGVRSRWSSSIEGVPSLSRAFAFIAPNPPQRVAGWCGAPAPATAATGIAGVLSAAVPTTDPALRPSPPGSMTTSCRAMSCVSGRQRIAVTTLTMVCAVAISDGSAARAPAALNAPCMSSEASRVPTGGETWCYLSVRVAASARRRRRRNDPCCTHLVEAARHTQPPPRSPALKM